MLNHVGVIVAVMRGRGSEYRRQGLSVGHESNIR